MGQQFTSIAKGLNLGGFQESKEEFLEKGKKAQIGEIREWKGQKFQKQPNGGWIPVKQGIKGSKKEFCLVSLLLLLVLWRMVARILMEPILSVPNVFTLMTGKEWLNWVEELVEPSKVLKNKEKLLYL